MFRGLYFDDDLLFGGFGGRGGRGGYGYGYGMWDDGDIYAGRAQVSDRAYRALDQAKEIFLKHLASVDTSAGPVKEEIVKFHLVPDMKKAFNKFVKEHGCTPSQRKLTREEQDKINKARKSLMIYSSVTVTQAAQQAYLAKKSTPTQGTTPTASTATAAPAPTRCLLRFPSPPAPTPSSRPSLPRARPRSSRATAKTQPSR
ncbi:hypothetical protein HMN09_01177400 [Mycena chlorophos]|uniref:Uncharacterized protein n=1 Tax=Mycena chlorophos TaxID=658473 RepID=A0A8H6S810_MYCCL|nr:hypothetical protein HMN09_01177400 [Mycena chlorophos]